MIRKMKSLTHILERAEATHAIAGQLDGWQWPERSLAQWGEAIQTFYDRRNEEFCGRLRLLGQRTTWDLQLQALHEFTTSVVRLGRVHFRARPQLARTFDFVKPDAKSRASIDAAARRLSSLWKKLAPDWQPEPTRSRAALDALREKCTTLGAGGTDLEADAILTVAALAETATQLDDDCVAWYGCATAVFLPDTNLGQHIRKQVPTSAVPQPPPDQAVITGLTTGPEGAIGFAYSAPHGTRFSVLHRPPGAAAYQPWRVDTTETSVTLHGLAEGEHRFKVVPANSRGEGPESAEAVVTLPPRVAAVA